MVPVKLPEGVMNDVNEEGKFKEPLNVLPTKAPLSLEPIYSNPSGRIKFPVNR